MKKIICLILAMFILVTVSACGSEKDSVPTVSQPETPASVDLIPLLCTDIGWQIVEDVPEYNSTYVTFYTFYEDGTCDSGYGFYLSEMLGGGSGTYTVDGNLLTIALTETVDGELLSYLTTYKVTPEDDGFILTQTSEEGYFFYHTIGTELHMEPYSAEPNEQ